MIDLTKERQLNLLKEISKCRSIDNNCDYLLEHSDCDDLIDYINYLQQENKILRENAEHNDKVVDKVNWENRLLKNRIEKAVKYIENNSLYEEEYDYDYEENIYLSGVNDEKAKNDLLDILEDK